MVTVRELAGISLALRDLPEDKVHQVRELVQSLRRDCGLQPIDISDEWTEEDMRDVALESLRQFDAEHPDEDWGENFSAAGVAK